MKTKGLLWALMLMALLTACSDEKAYRIGVSQCGGGQWREKVNQEILAAQHLYEHDVKISVACAHDNSQRQIEQIDRDCYNLSVGVASDMETIRALRKKMKLDPTSNKRKNEA